MIIEVYVSHGEQQGRCRELHNPCRLQLTRHGGEEEHPEAHHGTFNTVEHTKKGYENERERCRATGQRGSKGSKTNRTTVIPRQAWSSDAIVYKDVCDHQPYMLIGSNVSMLRAMAGGHFCYDCICCYDC